MFKKKKRNEKKSYGWRDMINRLQYEKNLYALTKPNNILLKNIWMINNSKQSSARGIMVIVVGNEHGDTSSNPGRDWLHFT